MPAPPVDSNDGLLDWGKITVMSEFVRRSEISLDDLVRLVRNECESDTRPNKDLYEMEEGKVPYVREWNEIVKHGAKLEMKRQVTQQTRRPKNHSSVKEAMGLIVKGYRKGQDKGKYLILELDLLESHFKEAFVSPIGAVEKPGYSMKEAIRQINDLSYPRGKSVNDALSLDGIPVVTYEGPEEIIKTALSFGNEGILKMMTADVAEAYRHVPIAAESVKYQAVVIQELKVVIFGLFAEFGSKSSAGLFNIPATIIQFLYSQSFPLFAGQYEDNTDNFKANRWSDDFVCQGIDRGSYACEATAAIKLAMVRVLGPRSFNNEKHSEWAVTQKALGLMWRLDELTLSMRQEKIDKGVRSITKVLEARMINRQTAEKLLGSLRYLALVFNSSKAFFQETHGYLRRLARGRAQVIVSEDVVMELTWLRDVLRHQKLNGIAFDAILKRVPVDVTIQMDASNEGLCAVDMTNKRFFQYEFTLEEKDLYAEIIGNDRNAFGINVREHLSAVLAMLCWADSWGRGDELCHVLFQIDNTAAVSWINKLYSPNDRAKIGNRIIAYCAIKNNLLVSAVHVPGCENDLADAGSRAWSSQKLKNVFERETNMFVQDQVDERWRNISGTWDRLSEATPWPSRQINDIRVHGNNGESSANPWVTQNGCWDYRKEKCLIGWVDSLYSAGDSASIVLGGEIPTRPSSERWLPSSTTTNATVTSKSKILHDSNCSCVESKGCQKVWKKGSPCYLRCSSGYSNTSSLNPAAKPWRGVEWCSPTSSCGGAQSTRVSTRCGPSLLSGSGTYHCGISGESKSQSRRDLPVLLPWEFTFGDPKMTSMAEALRDFSTSQDIHACVLLKQPSGCCVWLSLMEHPWIAQRCGCQTTRVSLVMSLTDTSRGLLELVERMSQDLALTHYESEELLRFSTLEPIRCQSSCWEGGFPLALRSTLKCSMPLQEIFPNVWFLAQPQRTIDVGNVPSPRPKAVEGLVNEIFITPMSLVQERLILLWCSQVMKSCFPETGRPPQLAPRLIPQFSSEAASKEGKAYQSIKHPPTRSRECAIVTPESSGGVSK